MTKGFARQYLAAAVASLFGPVVATVAVVRSAESEIWVAYAVGQTLGGLVAIVSGLAWASLGTQRLASSEMRAQAAIYIHAFCAKGMAWGAASAFGTGIGVVTVGDSVSEAATVAVTTIAFSLATFSLQWFAVATYQPQIYLRFEVLPRSAAFVALAGCVLLGAPVAVVGFGLIVVTGVSLCAFHSRHIPEFRARLSSPRKTFAGIRDDKWGSVSGVSGSLAAAAPLLMGAWLLPVKSVSDLAVLDRLFRYALQLVGTVTAILQPHHHWISQNVRKAIVLSATAGLAPSLLFATMANPLSDKVFHVEQQFPSIALLYAGSLLLNIALTPFFKFAIVPNGLEERAGRRVFLAAVASVVAMMALSLTFGLPGLVGGYLALDSLALIFVWPLTSVRR